MSDRYHARADALLDGPVPFIERPACGYKLSAIAQQSDYTLRRVVVCVAGGQA